jgi:RNA polymerase sigma-70 factor (ECF subfamily)
MSENRATINELAQICAYSADAAEWEELVHRCAPLVSLVALRVSRMWMNGSSTAMVDDIVQEIFLKLCEQERRILRDFKPRGEDSFLGLLRVVSHSVANDHFRRLYSVKRGGQVVTSPLPEEVSLLPSSGVEHSKALQQTVLFAQLDRKLRSAPKVIGERDRAIFWLYYRQGFTAEEIAGLPHADLTSKGVESALRRVAKWLRGEIAQRRLDDAAFSEVSME